MLDSIALEEFDKLMSGKECIPWQQANQRFLRAAIALMKKQLEKYIAFLNDTQWDNKQLEIAVTELNTAKELMPSASALERLYSCFNLQQFEIDLLLLCAAMELDSTFPQLCAQVQANESLTFPTFELALAALPETDWNCISSSATLRYWQLIEVQLGSTTLLSPLAIDENIFMFLMGFPYVDKRLAGIIDPLTTRASLAPSHQKLAQQIAATWVEAQQQEQVPLLQLCGNDRVTKQAIAATVAQTLGLSLSSMTFHNLPVSPGERNNLLRLWDREAYLFNCGLFIECDRLENSDFNCLETLHYFLEKSGSFMIVSSRERGLETKKPMLTFEVDKPTQIEQRQLWEHLVSEVDLDLNGLTNRLVFQFNMNYRAIHTTWTSALGQLSQTDSFSP